MKNFVKYTLAATLVAGAAAQPHQHQHHHAKKHVGSKVAKREPDAVTEYIVAATETVYELSGKILEGAEAKAAIDGGNLVIVGESQPTYNPPPPPETSSSSASEPTLGAQFFESQTSSTVAPEPTTTSISIVVSSASIAETTSSSSSPASTSTTTSVKPKATSSSQSSGSSSKKYTAVNDNVTKKFPKDLPCGSVPVEYGAVYLDWLEMDG